MKPLVFFMLLLLAGAASYAELIPEQEKLKEIQEKLETSKKKLVETKAKEGEALSKLVVAQKKLTTAQKDLNRANRRIVVNEGQIRELASDMYETRKDLQSKSEILKNRIREMHKNSTVNYLELLFSSTSMSDFINRSYFFSKIVERDVSLIYGITSDYNRIENNKERLEQTTESIKELASEIETEKKEIKVQAEEIKTLYSELKDRRENYEKQVAELERSSAQMEKIIVSKMAERAKQKILVLGSTGSLDWPLRGRITSKYGYRRHPYWGGRSLHTGIDIAAPHGEAVRAADGGAVIFAGWWDGYGKAIVVDHGKKVSTIYAHLSRIYLKAGDQAAKGQIVGLVGSTGYSTGPHLHFEVRVNGKPQNPYGFLP